MLRCLVTRLGLSFDEREQLAELNGPYAGELATSCDQSPDTFPPGEEAMFLSNAGGETELCEDLMANR